MVLDKIKNLLRAETQERKIFSDLKRKDRDAFIMAYDLYVDQIYRFVFFKISDSEEANDLTSAIFLKTWNYIQTNSLTDEKTLRALIYKIARTSIIDYYRKASNQNTISLDDERGDKIDFKDEKQDVIKKMETASDLENLEKKLGQLKEEYREVLVLRFINELSVKEIADALHKPKGNVRVLIHRALKALKEICEPSYTREVSENKLK